MTDKTEEELPGTSEAMRQIKEPKISKPEDLLELDQKYEAYMKSEEAQAEKGNVTAITTEQIAWC